MCVCAMMHGVAYVARTEPSAVMAGAVTQAKLSRRGVCRNASASVHAVSAQK